MLRPNLASQAEDFIKIQLKIINYIKENKMKIKWKWVGRQYVYCLQSWSARGASRNPSFMGSCPTISRTFFALSTKCMSSLSSKWEREISPLFHLIVFAFGVNQKYYKAWGVQDFPVWPQWWKPSSQIESHLKPSQTKKANGPNI